MATFARGSCRHQCWYCLWCSKCVEMLQVTLSWTTVKVALCDPLFHMHSDCATDRTPQSCTARVVLVVPVTPGTYATAFLSNYCIDEFISAVSSRPMQQDLVLRAAANHLASTKLSDEIHRAWILHSTPTLLCQWQFCGSWCSALCGLPKTCSSTWSRKQWTIVRQCRSGHSRWLVL